MPPDPSEPDYGTTIRAYAPDQQVFSRFTLVRMLGRGGMGVVWLARDQKLEREVALKFLPETVAVDPRAVDDLKRETRRSLDLTHPHIVRIHDFFEDNAAAAISMEYVEGGTLAKLAVQQKMRCFEPAEILPWIRQLIDALDYAHNKAKIVHRDLKPANLMVTVSGDLKITDFGISATVTDSLTRVSRLMSSGATPAYSSPQQVMGERPSPYDDIYSLGATIFDLVTGKPPFHTGNLLIQVQTKPPDTMTARREDLGVTGQPIPESWEKTIAACLAKEPAQRPASVRAVLAGLEGDAAYIGGETTIKPEPRKPFLGLNLSWLSKLGIGPAPVVPVGKDSAYGFRIAWSMVRGVRSPRRFLRTYQALLAGLAGTPPRITAFALPLVLLVGLIVLLIPNAEKTPSAAEPEIVFNLPNYLAPDAQSGLNTPAPPENTMPPAGGPPPIATAGASPLAPSATAGSGAARPPAVDDPARTTPRPGTATGAAAGAPGVVEILSEPAGALVLAEGREIGRTPLALPGVKPGPVEYTLRLAGFDEARLGGRVSSSETTRLSAQLRPIRAAANTPPPLAVQDLGITMVWLQPGEFLLGTAPAESRPESDEQPQTRVRFTKGFWIADTEVTQRQWWLLMGSNPSRNSDGGERLPVENVSWEQAAEFCAKLDARERSAGRLPDGYAYQLPTEAQWEYACRAGTLGSYAADLARIAVTGGRDSKTKPVASLEPNAWGLFDMHGNVAEWTRSWYGPYPGGTASDYAGPAEGQVRVFRGGAYDSSLPILRSAYRGWVSGSVARGNGGFRIALAPRD